MSENSAEKQFQPSERKLERLKKEGNFLRAKDFSGGLSLVAAIVLLILLSHHFMTILQQDFITAYSNLEFGTHETQAYTLYKQFAWDAFLIILPFGGALCVFVFFDIFIWWIWIFNEFIKI